MTDERKEFLASEECKKLLKWMGFEWSELDEVKELKKENHELKEKIKNSYLIPKGELSCHQCIEYEDLAGKVTYVGKPPEPHCRMGCMGFPYRGSLCPHFKQKCYNRRQWAWGMRLE